MLGRKLPLRTARKGGYFFVQRSDGTIGATLELANYFSEAAAAPVLPESVDWYSKAQASVQRVYLNDRYGDCVIAGKYHQVGMWTANESGTAVLGTDNEVLSMYHTICGPGDNGCDISQVLKYQQNKGLPFNGQIHKIDAFVSVDNAKQDLVKASMAIAASLSLGIDLPGAWEQSNDVWDVTNSRVVGGHDVPTGGYDKDYVTILTWGGKRRITWAAFTSRNYITECYLSLSPDWYAAAGVAPNGIDAATLKADLTAIANGQIPSVGPPEVPLDWLIALFLCMMLFV